MTIHERYPFTWKSDKKAIKEPVKKKPVDIDVLDLSPRAYNALKKGAVNTVEELISLGDKLGRMRNVGAKTVTEIQTKLLMYLANKEN